MHTVTFTFAPDSFRWGTVVSVLTALGLGVAIVLPVLYRCKRKHQLP